MPPTKKDKGKARRKKGQAAKAKPQKRKGGRVQVKGVSVTPFRLQVLALCAQVPAGKVTTYGLIAKALGTSARPVGGALRLNPFAPTVPCHRVVKSDFTVGGFSGQTDPSSVKIRKKVRLLGEECVHFTPEEKASRRLTDAADVIFDDFDVEAVVGGVDPKKFEATLDELVDINGPLERL